MTSGSMLVTGATGVIGSELVEQARAEGWQVVGCSSRGGNGSLSWQMDVAEPPSQLRRHWDVIVHAAARTRWNMPAVQADAANVRPLRQLLPLRGQDTHLIHVSTAFATGLRGSVGSADVDDYRNTYEWSKAAAERVIAGVGGVTVVRPPLVVGRRRDGHVARFSGLYTMLQSAVTGLLPALIGEADARLEIVSTCDVASCILRRASQEPQDVPLILGSGPGAPTLEQVKATMYQRLNDWRQAAAVTPLDVPEIVRPEQWQRFFLPFMRPHLSNRQLLQIERLSEFIPYLSTHEPLPVNEPIEDPLAAVAAAVGGWADRRPSVAAGDPRPWSSSELR